MADLTEPDDLSGDDEISLPVDTEDEPVVPETVEPESVDPDPSAPPPPVTPEMGSQDRHRRAMYERDINDRAALFAEEAKAAFIEAALDGRSVQIVAEGDASAVDPDISVETALAAAADAGLTPYPEWTVAQLSDECRKRDLPVSGTKDELVERLEADDAKDAAALTEE